MLLRSSSLHSFENFFPSTNKDKKKVLPTSAKFHFLGTIPKAMKTSKDNRNAFYSIEHRKSLKSARKKDLSEEEKRQITKDRKKAFLEGTEK
jgi:hypothetical protein